MKVQKRDKQFEEFQWHKVENAIRKAFEACDLPIDEGVMNCMKNKYDVNSDEIIDVETIQDDIENCLMDCNPRVAKAFIIYRYEHKVLREHRDKLIKGFSQKLLAENVENQNANVDEKSFGGRMGEASRLVVKNYALDYCMSRKARKNHLNNEIYTHDLDSYAIGNHNCLTYPLDESLAKGVKTRQTDIRPAKSISTAFQLLAVFFQIQSLQQFGGISASHLDWSMVPYVRMSFYKHFLKYFIHQKENEKNVDILSMSSDDRSNFRKQCKEGFNKLYNINYEKFSMGSFSMDCVNFHVDDERIKNINRIWYNNALDDTLNELAQAVEGMYHNLNSLQSRSGNQLPFSSINYGTCTLAEGRMVIKALLEGSIKGIGKFHKTPIFPCGIFQLMKGVNRKEGEPNYDLYQLALKSTSQRLYPNYANCDWSGNEGYDKNDPRTYFSTMGK